MDPNVMRRLLALSGGTGLNPSQFLMQLLFGGGGQFGGFLRQGGQGGFNDPFRRPPGGDQYGFTSPAPVQQLQSQQAGNAGFNGIRVPVASFGGTQPAPAATPAPAAPRLDPAFGGIFPLGSGFFPQNAPRNVPAPTGPYRNTGLLNSTTGLPFLPNESPLDAVTQSNVRIQMPDGSIVSQTPQQQALSQSQVPKVVGMGYLTPGALTRGGGYF